jgi:PKD repeat protein
MVKRILLLILVGTIYDLTYGQASIGNFTINEIGNDGILCNNESCFIQPLSGQIMPTDQSDPAIPYNPGIGLLIFSCPPSYSNNNPNSDPCLLGFVNAQAQSTNYSAIEIENSTVFLNTLPPPFNSVINAPFTIYIQMTTVYDINSSLLFYPTASPDISIGSTLTLTLQPNVTFTSTEDCLNQSIDISVNEGDPVLNPSVLNITNTFPSTAIFESTVNNGGTFSINNLNNGDVIGFELINPDGCTIFINNLPYVGAITADLITPTLLCENDAPVQLLANPPNGIWSGSTSIDNATGLFDPSLIDINQSTTYSLQYTPTNGAPGCNISQSFEIIVNPALTSTIVDPGLICYNDPVFQLTAATSGGVWTGPFSAITTSGLFNPDIAQPGTHTIVYSIPGNCGTSSSIDITILPPPLIQFTASLNQGCIPLEVDFANSSTFGGSNFKWFINQNALNETNSTFQYTFPLSQCYDVGLALTDLNGCRDTLDSIQVICPFVDPWIDFSMEPMSPTIDQPVVYFSSNNPGLVSNFWDFAGEANGNGFVSYHSFQSVVPGEFQVCLTAIDTNGCQNTGCQFVQLSSAFQIFAPSAFTPGDDGRNDAFKPVVVSPREVKHYELWVYNRWGDTVFHTEDPEQYWYGNKSDGEYYTRDDVYDWVLKITLYGLEDTRYFRGNVLIVR